MTAYSKKEIMKKFQRHRDSLKFDISDDEYELFCNTMSHLPKDVFEKIFDEVDLVILSRTKGGGQPACYLNLRKPGPEFENKKGIIFLSALVFLKIEMTNFLMGTMIYCMKWHTII